MSRPVRIVEYDPQWPILYEEEKQHILEAVGRRVTAIEHIGSSAVPGLGGKPIIDIMVGVDNSVDADECVPLLEVFGYRNVTPEPEEPDWYYCLGKIYQGETVKLKNYHLHLVKHMSDHWKKHLLFRDYLRTHPKSLVMIFVLADNLPAIRAYSKVGFKPSRTYFFMRGERLSRSAPDNC